MSCISVSISISHIQVKIQKMWNNFSPSVSTITSNQSRPIVVIKIATAEHTLSSTFHWRCNYNYVCKLRVSLSFVVTKKINIILFQLQPVVPTFHIHSCYLLGIEGLLFRWLCAWVYLSTILNKINRYHWIPSSNQMKCKKSVSHNI